RRAHADLPLRPRRSTPGAGVGAGMMDRGERLSVVCNTPADELKQFVDGILPALGPVEVLRNRTGLVMLPMEDSARGATFYLGEVLIAEAHVRLGGTEGYAACVGRDLEQALAAAIVDAALAGGIIEDQVAPFVARQAAALAEQDANRLRQVEATRIEMETF